MRIALAQIAGARDPAVNLQTAARLCSDAAARGARLIAFPEMFMALFGPGSAPAAVAQPLDGAFVRALEGIARSTGVLIAAGVWERIADDPGVANTLVLIAPDGGLLAHYRKLHLFDALEVRESATMRPGSERPPIVRVDDLRLGFAICYDLRFPELFRELALRGAEAVLVAAAWYAGPLKEDHWLTLLRARAIENTCFVFGVNQCGPRFSGRSAGFDPFGVLQAGAGEDPCLLELNLDRERLLTVRRKLPALDHCRGDLYPLTAPLDAAHPPGSA